MRINSWTFVGKDFWAFIEINLSDFVGIYCLAVAYDDPRWSAVGYSVVHHRRLWFGFCWHIAWLSVILQNVTARRAFITVGQPCSSTISQHCPSIFCNLERLCHLMLRSKHFAFVEFPFIFIYMKNF